MSIIWAEGFDHYGDGSVGNGGRDYMLAGAWAEFSWANGVAPRVINTQARTGAYSLKIEHNALATDSPRCRRVLGSSQIVVGCASGWYFTALPDANAGWGFEWRNNSNQCIVFLAVESDGAIGMYKGASRTHVASSDPVITAAAWQHIEAKLTIDSVVGACEVRVNDVTVLSVTDEDFGSAGATQMSFGMPAGETGSGNTVYLDDVVVWNDSGSDNNDFIGQCRVTTLYSTADTAQSDWTRNTGSDDYAAIDDNPPDADTTYISSNVLNDVSEFEFPDTPPETDNIKAIYIPVMAKLADAGVGDIQVSMVSGVEVALGPEQTLTTAYTYWPNVFERDPDTDAPWTKSGVEAALVRIEKVA